MRGQSGVAAVERLAAAQRICNQALWDRLTWREIAIKSDLPLETLRKIRFGKRSPSKMELARLRRVLPIVAVALLLTACEPPHDELVKEARASCASYGYAVPLGGGSYYFGTELGRDAEWVDCIERETQQLRNRSPLYWLRKAWRETQEREQQP